MTRGKSKAAKAAPPPPVKAHAKRYICELCHRHHGRYTSIGIAHRQYAREKKA